MNLVELVFKILDYFNLITADKRSGLFNKATQWHLRYIEGKDVRVTGDDAKEIVLPGLKEEELPGIVRWLRKYSQEWYVMVGFSISYIFIIRWIQDYMSPEAEPTDKV